MAVILNLTLPMELYRPPQDTRRYNDFDEILGNKEPCAISCYPQRTFVTFFFAVVILMFDIDPSVLI